MRRTEERAAYHLLLSPGGAKRRGVSRSGTSISFCVRSGRHKRRRGASAYTLRGRGRRNLWDTARPKGCARRCGRRLRGGRNGGRTHNGRQSGRLYRSRWFAAAPLPGLRERGFSGSAKGQAGGIYKLITNDMQKLCTTVSSVNGCQNNQTFYKININFQNYLFFSHLYKFSGLNK